MSIKCVHTRTSSLFEEMDDKIHYNNLIDFQWVVIVSKKIAMYCTFHSEKRCE